MSLQPAVPMRLQSVRRPSDETIAVVVDSCSAVADRPVVIVERFYEHLFALVPETRAMFPADMTMQNEKLCKALLDAITSLGAPGGPDATEAALRRMGAWHGRRHSVVPEHYPYVGRALVRAIRDVSANWAPSVGSAWVAVYEWLAATMIAGGIEAELEAEREVQLEAARQAERATGYARGGVTVHMAGGGASSADLHGW